MELKIVLFVLWILLFFTIIKSINIKNIIFYVINIIILIIINIINKIITKLENNFVNIEKQL
jgi:hypothetical protein